MFIASSYAYRAKVEYRDTDHNGVPDIVVTPVERRNAGDEFPSETRILSF